MAASRLPKRFAATPVAPDRFRSTIRASTAYDQGLDSVEKSRRFTDPYKPARWSRDLTWIGLFIALSPMLDLWVPSSVWSTHSTPSGSGDISPTLVAGGIKGRPSDDPHGSYRCGYSSRLCYNYIVSKIDSLVNTMEDSSITLMDILTAYNKK